MKRKLLLAALLTCFGLNLKAQYPTSNYLSAGNIKAPILSDGGLFWNSSLVNNAFPYNLKWESPKNSGKSTIFASSLWIGGRDQNNNLYVAAETFRQYSGSGSNPSHASYFFGPVATTYNAAFDAKYNKVWKVTATEIKNHKLLYRKRFYTMPDAIANWPAHGNTANGEAANLAPFVDVNNNNIYDPLNGDYPVIRGAETLYFILNDKRYPKQPLTPAMNIEIHGMAYAFDKPGDSALYNTVFLNYRIINRSANNYSHMYAGIWTDFDIGDFADDFVGCDVSRNTYIGYNGDDLDSSYTNPAIGYNRTPPVQAVTFLGNTKLNSFVFYKNDSDPKNGNPSTPSDYYNYLRGIWRNNQPVTFGGNGTDISAEPYRYMFPGDSDPTGKGYSPKHAPPFNWTMNSTGIIGTSKLPPADVRGIGAFGPFNLNAGQELCFDVAFPFAHNPNPIITSGLLPRYIDQINQYFNANLANACPQNQTSTNPPNGQRHAFESFFPNPATNDVTLYFDQRLTEDVTIKVYDINGKLHTAKVLKQDDAAVQTIDLQSLKPGVYILNMVDSGSSKKMKVVVTK